MVKILIISYFLFFITIFASAQPVEVKELEPSASNLTALGNMAYYTTSNALYKTNGTSIGTVIVKTGLLNPSNLFTNTNNNLLYFINNNNELWRSDGTSSGTYLLKRSELNNIQKLVTNGNLVFFTSEDGLYGREIYRTDGTVGGTIFLKDINPGDSSGVNSTYAVGLGNQVYFAGYHPSYGTEIWKSDGSTNGTVMIKDIHPGTPSSVDSIWTNYNKEAYPSTTFLYFAAVDGVHGREPWRTDGTINGTQIIQDLSPGSSSSAIDFFSTYKNKGFFLLDSINSDRSYVYITDGLESGTKILTSVPESAYPVMGGPSIVYNDQLYFFLSYVDFDYTYFYVTDGTPVGTKVVYPEIMYGGFMHYLDTLNNEMIFWGIFDYYGTAFFKSDGTQEGTVGFAGPVNDYDGPSDVTKLGKYLFFGNNYGTPDFPDNPDDYLQLYQSDLTETFPLRSRFGTSYNGAFQIENVDGTLFFMTEQNLYYGGGKKRLWTYNPNVPAACSSTGKVLREYWSNVSGYPISGIPVNSPPTNTSMPVLFEGPQNIGDNYGERYRAYICAAVTGDYTFYISSDDNSELWLSSDADTANIAKIASVSGYTNYRQWDKYASQQSAPIHLIAGRKYFIQALHKEVTGNDHISVGWQLPNGTQERPIPGNRLSPFYGFPNFEPTVSMINPIDSTTFTAPTTITINAQAKDSNGAIVAVEFYHGTTLLGKDSTAPYSYTWNSVAPGTYKLTAKAYDNDGAAATSAAVSITVNGSQGCTASGSILRELWSNVTGTGVNTIPVSTTPTSTSQISLFEGPINVGDNYAARYRGYICAPMSGNYTFWIASDDYSELWLSTNDNPANKVKIAYVNGYTSSRQWTKYTTQQSASINLVAGQRYYIEALHKEAYGNDNLAVGWQLPNGVQERPIGGNRLSPYTTTGNQSPFVSITSPTNGQSFAAPASITINANASDADGTISKVEFFHEGTKIGEDLTSPYSMTWNNVNAGSYNLSARATDNGGAQTTSSQVAITVVSSTNCTASGTIIRELWTNVSGTTVASIPVSNSPTSSSQLSIFEGPTNVGDNYGARYRGYICVPTTGNYTFWIASDDQSELWLSTDDQPVNKKKIANVPDHTSSRQWDKYTSQKSIAINLVAGQRYYIEALHKEATGQDNLAVGWQLPNGTQERPIPGNRLSPYNSSTVAAKEAMFAEDQPITDSIEVSIFPNPTQKGIITLTVDGYEGSKHALFINIVNPNGEVVYNEKVSCEITCRRTPLNIDEKFTKGLYIVKVVVNGRIFTKRLVVE